MIEEALVKMFIDRLSHRGMAWFLRFSSSGHPLFNDSLPFHRYFNERFNMFGGWTPELSKEIGHDEKTEKKVDIFLESTDDAKISLWLVWMPMELTWYIQKWVMGYTVGVSETDWFSVTEGVRAWIEGDYQLVKVDGVYDGDQ